MADRIWFCFIAALAIVASVNGSPIEKNATRLDSGKVTVNGNYIAVNLDPDREVDILKEIKSLEQRLSDLEKPRVKACNFDFEDGIGDWEKTGTAFNNQPTYGDNPKVRDPRGRKIGHAKQQGDWWIGGFENRPSKSAPAGGIQGDGLQGTLTSPPFKITGKNISFLIGGGCYHQVVGAELIVGAKMVARAKGTCRETMVRKYWDVGDYIGQTARVRLYDYYGGNGGHINFDDLRGDIICEEHWNKIRSVSSSSSELYKDKKGQ